MQSHYAKRCNGTGVDEAALIRKNVGGQRDLFGDLIAPHLTALSRIVRTTIGGHPEFEDIVQHETPALIKTLRYDLPKVAPEAWSW